MVDFFSSNSNGFDLVWNTAGQYLDCSMDPECGSNFNDPGGAMGYYVNNLDEEYVICPDAVVMPFSEREVSLTITNLNGCEADDGIRIGVDTRPNVYIPSAFSPNNDGVNDVIYPFAGRAVESIINFQIFDRWGEKVFETNNFSANAIESGWDGRLNGKLMNPQVLIYSVEILLINGDRQVPKGDFVLMR